MVFPLSKLQNLQDFYHNMIAQASQSHPRMRQMRIVGIDAPEFLWYDK